MWLGQGHHAEHQEREERDQYEIGDEGAGHRPHVPQWTENLTHRMAEAHRSHAGHGKDDDGGIHQPGENLRHGAAPLVVCSAGRTMHRNPMWQAELSTASPWRAAGL